TGRPPDAPPAPRSRALRRAGRGRLPDLGPAGFRGDRVREPLPGAPLPGAELQSDGLEGRLHRGGRRAYPRARGPDHAGAPADGGRLRQRAACGRAERPGRHRQSPGGEREPVMKLFDPHIHMTSRTTLDYEAMAQAGIAAIVEPSFWLGQPRTHVGTFED